MRNWKNGRAVKNFDPEKWDSACYEIVKCANFAKFSQNPELWGFLKHYQSSDYARPSVATDMVIFTVTEEQEDNYRKLPEKELHLTIVKY